MKFKLLYPAKPFHLNQAWGILNPIYEQFGFKRHNGIDFALGDDKKLYAPCAGTVVRTGDQPSGGGIFLGLMTFKYNFTDGDYRVLLDFLHCDNLLVKEGDVLEAGDVMAIADNTGFSTGPHTHLQARRVKDWNGRYGSELQWALVDRNDANNSFDPLPSFNGFYASDSQTVVGKYNQLIMLLQQLVGLLKIRNQITP